MCAALLQGSRRLGAIGVGLGERRGFVHRNRLRDDQGPDFRSGTWIAADGTPVPVTGNEISLVPIQTTSAAGTEVPTSWRIEVPSHGAQIDVQAIYPDSWTGNLVRYWEGPVSATGSHMGVGYLEMTGYE